MTPSPLEESAGADSSGSLEALVDGWRRRLAWRRMAVIARRAALCGLALLVPLAALAGAGAVPWALAVALPLLLLAVLLLLGLRGGPTRRETAHLLDHDLGLAARVGTALELDERPAATGPASPLAARVVRDATARLAATPGRVMERPAGREWAGLTVTLLLAVGVLLMATGPAASSPSAPGPTASAGGPAGAPGAGRAATTATTATTRARPAATVPAGPVRVTTAPAATTPTVLTPASRRPTAPVPPALGAQPGAGPEPGQRGTTAALRGGRIQAPKGSGSPAAKATTDNPAATQGADRGVTPAKQPPGAKRTGSPATGKGERGAVGEGAAPLPGAPSDRRTGTQTGAGTPGKPGTGAKQTTQNGQPIPTAKNTAGSPTRQRGGKSSGQSGSKGAPGTGGDAGSSKGRNDPGQQAARRLKAPGALPLSTGFRAGPAPSTGKPGTGTGQGDGRGRGEAERGSSAGSTVGEGAIVGFAFPDLRTAAGARSALLLNYFGAVQ